MEAFQYTYIDIFISLVLASIMFGLGLSLTVSSFRNILVYPRAFFIGLSSQMIALPVIAFLILLFSDIPDVYKVGIMILAVCPGGTTSGFVTYLFKGNVALSISLTAINSVLTIFTIPFVVNFSLQYFMKQDSNLHLPILDSFIQIFLVTLLPASLGVFVHRIKPNIAKFLEKQLKYILMVLLAIVYSVKFFAGEQYGGTGITAAEAWTIFPYTLIFNVACFILSIGFGKLTRLTIRDAFTIAIEVTLHNTTLALLIAGTLLHNQEMVKPALVYSMFSFWSAILFGIITKLIYKDKLSFEK
ncbi:MAG: bile acid:sodium symporter family protein [Saprospiraceae bacterium]|nr:bile acid:sodium symporter family protein [Saprospiraceae bacterium]